MAYIGKSPVIGNFVKLDAITAVNGQAAYTMQNGGANFTDYESVNEFLVSLNGTIQAPTDSFTVSGSTLTFASNLATGDVIDFVMVFGNSLSAGTPTDATVSTAKIINGAVTNDKVSSSIINSQTAETSIADADEVLIYDSSASALRKMTKANFVSGVGGANTPAFFATSIISEDNTAISNDTFTKLTMDTEVFDTDNTYSSDRFTPGVAGKYLITAKASATNVVNSATVALAIYKNGSIMEAVHYSNYGTYTSYFNDLGNANAGYYTMALNVFVDANSTDYFELYGRHNIGGNTGGLVDKYFGAIKIIE